MQPYMDGLFLKARSALCLRAMTRQLPPGRRLPETAHAGGPAAANPGSNSAWQPARGSRRPIVRPVDLREGAVLSWVTHEPPPRSHVQSRSRHRTGRTRAAAGRPQPRPGCGPTRQGVATGGHTRPAPPPGPPTPPPPNPVPSRAHDRPKQHHMALPPKPGCTPSTSPMNRGRPRPGQGDKLRQIERYADLLGHLIKRRGLDRRAQALTLADMGCGKGYLTFAAWHLLRRT
jgi:hypothetical protein